MKKYLTLLSCLFICLSFNTVFAQPSNDDPCAAINLTLGSPYPGQLLGATVLPGEVSPPNAGDCFTDWCDGTLDGTVWFTFVAPPSGNVVITSCSDFNNADTQFALYEVGDCLSFPTFNLLAANDDKSDDCTSGGSPFASEISYCGLTLGNTYYVQVDGYMGDMSDFEITVSDVGTCPNYCYIQFVHSSPDLSVETVDVRIDGVLVADNLSYGEATGFLLVDNIMNPNITVNPSNSVDDMSAYFGVSGTLGQQVNYVVAIVGINDAGNYNIDETGAYMSLTGMEVTMMPNNPNLSQVTFINTVTDVSGLRYYFDGAEAFTGGLYYGEIRQDEYTLPDYPFEIYDINNPSHYGRFNIPFGDYVGENITIITSGFIDPGMNNNGPELSMCVVHQDGTVDCFEDQLSLNENDLSLGIQLAPNPAKEEVKVKINSKENLENLSIRITEITGQTVAVKILSALETAEKEVKLDVSGLSSGTYYISLIGDNYSSVPEALVVNK